MTIERYHHAGPAPPNGYDDSQGANYAWTSGETDEMRFINDDLHIWCSHSECNRWNGAQLDKTYLDRAHITRDHKQYSKQPRANMARNSSHQKAVDLSRFNERHRLTLESNSQTRPSAMATTAPSSLSRRRAAVGNMRSGRNDITSGGHTENISNAFAIGNDSVPTGDDEIFYGGSISTFEQARRDNRFRKMALKKEEWGHVLPPQLSRFVQYVKNYSDDNNLDNDDDNSDDNNSDDAMSVDGSASGENNSEQSGSEGDSGRAGGGNNSEESGSGGSEGDIEEEENEYLFEYEEEEDEEEEDGEEEDDEEEGMDIDDPPPQAVLNIDPGQPNHVVQPPSRPRRQTQRYSLGGLAPELSSDDERLHDTVG